MNHDAMNTTMTMLNINGYVEHKWQFFIDPDLRIRNDTLHGIEGGLLIYVKWSGHQKCRKNLLF